VGPRTTYEALLVASFAIGFGAGFYETILNAVVVEEWGSRAPRRLLFIHSAATCGAAVTLFAIGFLREPLGLVWYDSFRAAGLLHAALLFGVPLLPTLRPSVHDPGNEAASRSVEGRRLLIAICVATCVYVGVESALTTFVADHAEKNLGFSAERAAGVVGFFWSGLLAGRLAVGLSHKEPGAGTTALLALISSAVVAAFFVGWTTSPELAMALTGFFLGGVFPIMIGLAGVTMPGAAGTAVAFAAGLGSLGGFLIPWLTGILAAHTGLEAALTSLSPWLLVLAITSAAVHRRQIR
jgi:fucose permease